MITRTQPAAMITRTQSWTLRIVVALVATSFFGNAVYALMTWLHTLGS